MSASILIFGVDVTLLLTRRWLLEAQGYRCYSVTRLLEFDSFAAHIPMQLLILCHSLDEQECREAEHHARSRWPEIALLALANGALKSCRFQHGEMVLDIDGPSKFLASVRFLLSGAPAQLEPAYRNVP